jgi:hypothetical protein
MHSSVNYECHIEGHEAPLKFTTLVEGARMLNEVFGMPLFTRHILSNWVSGRSKASKYKHVRLVRKVSV